MLECWRPALFVVGEIEENNEDSAHHDVGGGRCRHKPADHRLFGRSLRQRRRCAEEGLEMFQPRLVGFIFADFGAPKGTTVREVELHS